MRHFTTTFLLLSPIAIALATCTPAPENPPVNVVLISIDSLRADHVSAYGYRRKTTPTLDRLARQGSLFENVVAESSWTLPTHVTMLTGLATSTHGVEQFTGARLDAESQTLAEILSGEGYRTFGVFSGPYLHPAFGLSRGFERYLSADGDVVCVAGDCNTGADALSEDEAVKAARVAAHESVTSPLVTQRGLDFIRSVGDEPFFLFLHYFDVHFDYVPPEEYAAKFDPDYEGSITGKRFEANRAVHAFMNKRDLRHILALYDGEVLFVDDYIGQVILELKRHGFEENTLVVVTSDHGDEFFEHRGKGHGLSLFDEVIKVPLIMRLPGSIPPGSRVESQVRQVDIMPTILGLIGRPELAKGSDGLDLAAWLTTGEEPPRQTATSRLRANGEYVSIRTNEYKLLLYRSGTTEEVTLFDLKTDPAEKNPVFRGRQDEQPFAATGELTELWRALMAADDVDERRRNGSPGSGSEPELTEELREQLRSLGYIP
jgi:arylsulfatase A-like enzyme